jgi:hypothetical protein
MKYILSVFFALFVVFGLTRQSQAVRVEVLDPNPNLCGSDPIASGCVIFDPSQPLTIDLTPQACVFAGVQGLDPSGNYGCAILLNLAWPPKDITSLNVTFSGLDGLDVGCENGGSLGIFKVAECGAVGGGAEGFSFYDGSFGFGEIAIIYEDGINPCPANPKGEGNACTLFQGGVATTNADPLSFVPEPDSLLLLSTGAMMAGLYMARRHRLFASLRN